jgi:hypothetical protein
LQCEMLLPRTLWTKGHAISSVFFKVNVLLNSNN